MIGHAGVSILFTSIIVTLFTNSGVPELIEWANTFTAIIIPAAIIIEFMGAALAQFALSKAGEIETEKK